MIKVFRHLFRKMEVHYLHVTKADFDKCGSFYDPKKCVLATATKRQFDTPDVVELSTSIKINGKRYNHDRFCLDCFLAQKMKAEKANNPADVIFTIKLKRVWE